MMLFVAQDLPQSVLGATRPTVLFLVEQGLLVGTTEFFAKSHVLKREYEDEEHPFGWMQDGVFELFDREGRLYRWQTEEELVDVSEDLP
jgi:hypothetical protein